ncbi:MAG: c-type cytochrome domain-containing protein, partial [Rhodothermales bacterium]
IILILIGLLMMPLLPVWPVSSPGWLAWLGRFHPLLVHFPLVLVPLLGLIELLSYLNSIARSSKKTKWPATVHLEAIKSPLWFIAVFSTLLSIAAGYLLYGSGDYGGELATEHFWGGVITCILLIAAAISAGATASVISSQLLYRCLLGASLLGILYTGHHGGMLTHGPSFFTEALPVGLSSPLFEDKPKEELLVYQDVIAPILDQKCLSCHNANKTKGGLKMVSLQDIYAGGDSGEMIITAGQPENSALYHRITLPVKDDDHMPPEGKAPLNQVEKELIAWWIEQGASADAVFGAGPSDPEQSTQFNRYIDKQQNTRRQRFLKQEEITALAEELNTALNDVRVETDPSTKKTSLAVSMKIPPALVDDNHVGTIVAQTDQITSLSLVGSEVSDDALFHISQLPDLRSLYLAYTSIDGSGLAYLTNAQALERLNISNTLVTNESIMYLTKLPALREVYLHGTKIDSLMIHALRSFMPEVEISESIGPLHH